MIGYSNYNQWTIAINKNKDLKSKIWNNGYICKNKKQ